jgi:exo-beta-1,3-glucanase (GH17 family)
VWTLLDHPRVIGAVDVVMVSILPFFDGHSAADAIHQLALAYDKAVTAADGKPVVIGETGWPSVGSKIGGAVPSPANAADFLLRFVSWARTRNISYFYSEAFDQDWRHHHDTVHASWGLWDSRGAMKPEVRAVFSGTFVTPPA